MFEIIQISTCEAKSYFFCKGFKVIPFFKQSLLLNLAYPTRSYIKMAGVQMNLHNTNVTTTLSIEICAVSQPVLNNSVALLHAFMTLTRLLQCTSQQ